MIFCPHHISMPCPPRWLRYSELPSRGLVQNPSYLDPGFYGNEPAYHQASNTVDDGLYAESLHSGGYMDLKPVP